MVLAPLAALYRAGLAARDLYRMVRPSPAHHPGVLTIVVGNLSTGGTGKTSMVSWLAGELESSGLRCAILSRGYRRPDASRSPEIVSRGNGPAVGWERAGDEPWLLARRHRGVIVVVGRDRAASSQVAVAELGAEVIVLDDALQHRGIASDLAILMIDARRPPWEDHLLPWGRLREPMSAGRRAGAAVVVASAKEPVDFEAFRSRLGAMGIPDTSIARRRARAVVAHPSGEQYDPATMAGRRVFLFSGIGDPRGFEATVRELGMDIAGHRVFRDHQPLHAGDIASVKGNARESGADVVMTTEKDAVRLGSDDVMSGAMAAGTPMVHLEIELEVSASLAMERDSARERDAAGERDARRDRVRLLPEGYQASSRMRVRGQG